MQNKKITMMDVIERDDRMYCEIYSCKMSISTCVKRQQNAIDYKNGQRGGIMGKPGAFDVNCQKCEQGRKIMENQGKGPVVEEKPDEIEALIDLICLEEKFDRKKLHDKEMSPKRLRPIRVKLAQALHANGLINREVAAKIGCPVGSVHCYVNDYIPGSQSYKASKTPDPEKDSQQSKPDARSADIEDLPGPKSQADLDTNGNALTIDFSKHPEVLKKINNTAEKLMRDPEAQVLFWLVNTDIEKMEQLG
jgi:hypothetical protein